jgi:hypothetical protein
MPIRQDMSPEELNIMFRRAQDIAAAQKEERLRNLEDPGIAGARIPIESYTGPTMGPVFPGRGVPSRTDTGLAGQAGVGEVGGMVPWGSFDPLAPMPRGEMAREPNPTRERIRRAGANLWDQLKRLPAHVLEELQTAPPITFDNPMGLWDPSVAGTPLGPPAETPTGIPDVTPTGTPLGPPAETPTGPPTGIPAETPTGTPLGPPAETPTGPPTGPPTVTPTGPPTVTPTGPSVPDHIADLPPELRGAVEVPGAEPREAVSDILPPLPSLAEDPAIIAALRAQSPRRTGERQISNLDRDLLRLDRERQGLMTPTEPPTGAARWGDALIGLLSTGDPGAIQAQRERKREKALGILTGRKGELQEERGRIRDELRATREEVAAGEAATLETRLVNANIDHLLAQTEDLKVPTPIQGTIQQRDGMSVQVFVDKKGNELFTLPADRVIDPLSDEGFRRLKIQQKWATDEAIRSAQEIAGFSGTPAEKWMFGVLGTYITSQMRAKNEMENAVISDVTSSDAEVQGAVDRLTAFYPTMLTRIFALADLIQNEPGAINTDALQGLINPVEEGNVEEFNEWLHLLPLDRQRWYIPKWERGNDETKEALLARVRAEVESGIDESEIQDDAQPGGGVRESIFNTIQRTIAPPGANSGNR